MEGKRKRAGGTFAPTHQKKHRTDSSLEEGSYLYIKKFE